MTREVVGFLEGRGAVVDMTLGAGGHATALLEAGVPLVVGVDRDSEAIETARSRLSGYGSRIRLANLRFSGVDQAFLASLAAPPIGGVLYDLGVSSMQLDSAERGFSFRHDGPLDMRMGMDGPSAAELVNSLPEAELADIIFQNGQEHRARRIARAIARSRSRAPIETTDELTRVIVGAVGRRPGGPHPARRTFQALRIAVNRELEELAASLPRAVGLLAPGGRVVVISYHSLEDRLVKRSFAEDARLDRLTKKPLRPSEDEVASNPRARSARLRAAERPIQETA